MDQTIHDSLDEFARATTITAGPRHPGDILERLDTRLVAPFYEVLFEVPWDWIHEWSKELELPLYYRDEEGTGTLQVQIDGFSEKCETPDTIIEKTFQRFLKDAVPKLGHDPVSAIRIPDDNVMEALLFKRIDPDYEGSNGTEVSIKWTRFTRFSRTFSIVNFDFLVSREQYTMPRVQKELELLHEGILRARVRPPAVGPES